MSTVLFGGNTYAAAATYETYVEYKVDDTTLNPFNHITIYAGRPSGPAQGDTTDVASLMETVIMGRYTPSSSDTSTSIGAGSQPSSTPEVPEPGYSLALLVALVVGASCLRWKRCQADP